MSNSQFQGVANHIQKTREELEAQIKALNEKIEALEKRFNNFINAEKIRRART